MKKLIVLIFAALAFVSAAQAQTAPKNSAPSASTTEEKEKRKVFRATKDQITEAQKMLKEKGRYAGAEDGKYSPDFRASVREFQGENGLRKSGSLNRTTLEKMGIALTASQKEMPANPNDLASAGSGDKPAVKRGPVFRANKDQITQVQQMLREKSMYAGEDTGKLDDATRDGIKKWQAGNGVKVTGTLNKETLEKMGVELTETQKTM